MLIICSVLLLHVKKVLFCQVLFVTKVICIGMIWTRDVVSTPKKHPYEVCTLAELLLSFKLERKLFLENFLLWVSLLLLYWGLFCSGILLFELEQVHILLV